MIVHINHTHIRYSKTMTALFLHGEFRVYLLTRIALLINCPWCHSRTSYSAHPENHESAVIRRFREGKISGRTPILPVHIVRMSRTETKLDMKGGEKDVKEK